MFFQKINKVKHKFKLKLQVAKFLYQPIEQIDQKTTLFKLKITRGSHKIQIFSHHPHHGKIRFSKTQNVIPMTLFYDEDEQVYLQKDAEVKAYVCDSNGNVASTIGTTGLNVAEYAKNLCKFALEIQIDGENKQKVENAVVVFHMEMERQDDDSKSVNTYSEDQSQIRGIKPKQKSKHKDKHNNSINQGNFLSKKQNLLRIPDTDNFQIRSVQQNGKDKFKSQVDEKFSYEDKINASPMGTTTSQLKQKRSKNPKKRSQDFNKDSDFFDKFDSNKKDNIYHNFKNGDTFNKDQVIVQSFSQGNHIATVQKQDQSSPEFKLYMAEQKLKSFQRQNVSLHKQTDRLKQVIEKLVSQKSNIQIHQYNETNQYTQQINYYKNIIIQKQMRVSQLEGMQKVILQRETEKEQQLKQCKKQIKEIRAKLQFQKHKVAKILQSAMQQGNSKLISLIESEIQDELY